ncbi:MAG: acetyl/propionyl/methylcrotonyl-CoA carboxylase subunit alpha [Pseudomonadota bacterium]
MFNKILIANRGEIACRITRTARRMGVATAAVFSDADRDALHVEMADEALHIGPAPARESYLRGDRILTAAAQCGADAIHPGYGFLSENASFARACNDANRVFIGPSAQAIESMGSKAAAKRIMEAANVPLLPGYHDAPQGLEPLRDAADSIGYPVLLKATAGGGGKGMRIVTESQDFDDALAAARREAMASFGDDSMLVEKYLTRPRHVEIQVFFDRQGNGLYLSERDCSLQRRHQKVIEEAPAPCLDDETRKRMGEAALQAARAIDYCNAGTVEFLLDEDGKFYFMEMNTRLQVEHPVTEMITGLDLVEWQLRVAAGEPLPLSQAQVCVTGHAFEARIYAEDPHNEFLPSTGQLDFLQVPSESDYLRVETGVREGDSISIHYDPMIAKLVVWDENRNLALSRLAQGLAQYRIGGTITNTDFLYNLATCAPFKQLQLETSFIERFGDLLFAKPDRDQQRELSLAAVALVLVDRRAAHDRTPKDSPWQAASAWRLNQPSLYKLHLHCHQTDHWVAVEQSGQGFRVEANGQTIELMAELQDDVLQFELHGHRQRAIVAVVDEGYVLYLPSGACAFRPLLPDTGESSAAHEQHGLTAPMNGTIVTLMAEPGQSVVAGDPLLIMEAMKMEHTIRAPATGTVRSFHYRDGDLVDGGAELLDFELGEP